MLHPSYAELIKTINQDADNENQVINSRYSIVLATAKRARQLIDGRKPLSKPAIDKPLSIAVDELSKGLIKIQPEEENAEADAAAEELILEEEFLSEDLAEEIADSAEDSLSEDLTQELANDKQEEQAGEE